MVTLTINGQTVQVPAGTTILEAAEKAGIKIPTLCYLKDINKIAACRMCVVEVEGSDRLAAACDTPVEEGLVVHTNTPKVRKARRVNMELLLSQHASYCSTCIRSGNCPLQKLANDLNIHEMPYHVHVARGYTDTSTPLVRQASKCIKCMRCVQICEKVQTMGIWDLAGTGSRTTVDVSGNRTLKTSDCTFCGQCPGRHGEGTGRPGGPGNHHGSADRAGGAGGLGGVLRPDRKESGHGEDGGGFAAAGLRLCL